MKIAEIAHKLIVIRETRMTGYIMSGQLREELGFEGYAEALRRRWILADEDASGMVTLSNNLGTVAEMRALAEEHEKSKECGVCHKTADGCKCEKCKDCGHAKCTCESKAACESAILAQAHAFRAKPGLQEIATMGVGQTADHSTPVVGVGNAVPNPATQQQQQNQQPPNRPGNAPVQVGTDVRVVQDGKTFAGKVAKVNTDGKYEVSFAADKPAVVRSYDHTELQPVTDAPR